MTKKEDDAKRDAVLLRMLKTPPTPHKPKGATKPKPNQAEQSGNESGGASA